MKIKTIHIENSFSVRDYAEWVRYQPISRAILTFLYAIVFLVPIVLHFFFSSDVTESFFYMMVYLAFFAVLVSVGARLVFYLIARNMVRKYFNEEQEITITYNPEEGTMQMGNAGKVQFSLKPTVITTKRNLLFYSGFKSRLCLLPREQVTDKDKESVSEMMQELKEKRTFNYQWINRVRAQRTKPYKVSAGILTFGLIMLSMNTVYLAGSFLFLSEFILMGALSNEIYLLIFFVIMLGIIYLFDVNFFTKYLFIFSVFGLVVAIHCYLFYFPINTITKILSQELNQIEVVVIQMAGIRMFFWVVSTLALYELVAFIYRTFFKKKLKSFIWMNPASTSHVK